MACITVWLGWLNSSNLANQLKCLLMPCYLIMYFMLQFWIEPKVFLLIVRRYKEKSVWMLLKSSAQNCHPWHKITSRTPCAKMKAKWTVFKRVFAPGQRLYAISCGQKLAISKFKLLKLSIKRAAVVVKWSACSPTSLTIRVWIPLKPTVLFCKWLEKNEKEDGVSLLMCLFSRHI